MPGIVRYIERYLSQGLLGKMLVERAKGFLVDKLVSAKTLVSLLRGNGVLPPELVAKIPPDRLMRRTMVADKSYGPTMDVFVVKFRSVETGEEASGILSRNRWFLWKAVAVRLSSTSFLFPISFRPEPGSK
jgi:hypothetical protein